MIDLLLALSFQIQLVLALVLYFDTVILQPVRCAENIDTETKKNEMEITTIMVDLKMFIILPPYIIYFTF